MSMECGKMQVLDKREFIAKSKALSEEERNINARLTPTDILQDALRRRDELCTDIIKALCFEINKLTEEATIQDKEAVLKECGAIMRLYESKYNMEA